MSNLFQVRGGTRLRLLVAASAAGVALMAGSAPVHAAARDNIAYVVPPTRVSPLHGVLQVDNPTFREPQLLWTDHGLVTAFMEIPADDSAHRLGWTCTSDTGQSWACSPVSRGPGGTDWADPWLADSRGDPCPTYGHGLTMAALRASPSAVLEPVAYYSLDFGKTWVGPTVLPYPENIEIPLADGSKVIYTGRTYIAWRDFTFLTGEYVSQLQYAHGSCSWAVPVRMTTFVGANNALGYDDGSDHPRLAATPKSGGLAMRGSFGDGDLLTFHRFSPSQTQDYQSVIGSSSHGEDALESCTAPPSDCLHEIDELGTTLLYLPNTGGYLTIYSKYDTGGANPDSIGLWFQRSTDTGRTWSAPVELAGPSVDGSYIVMEETLAYDTVTGDAVLAYWEVPKQSSYSAVVRLQVWRPDASAWSPPRTIRVASWANPQGSEKRWGDYFGLQAHNGIAYVADGLYDSQDHGYIEYYAVRYPR